MNLQLREFWMNMRSLYNEPAMVIPFKHYKHDGKVVIYYGKNEDPVEAGFDIIPNLNFDINLCRGFPVMHARIEYSGLGYRQLFGWIQIITDEYYQSGEKGKVKKSVVVDVVADTFLTTVPGRSIEEKISCIKGFRWGCIEYANPKQNPPSILPLQAISKDVWNSHLQLLKKQFKKWKFL
jgi:hypothetical protein